MPEKKSSLIDVDDDLLVRQAKLVGGALDDPPVRLM